MNDKLCSPCVQRKPKSTVLRPHKVNFLFLVSVLVNVFTKLFDLCNQMYPVFSMQHCKNTWVTSTTFLSCPSCINVTKECYQIGFLKVCRGASSFVTLANLVFQKTYLATFLAFLCSTTMQPRNSPGADV